MGGGGGQSPTDYRSEIDKGLSEANTPKSDLAKQLSSYFGSMLPGVGQGAGTNPPSAGQNAQGQNPFAALGNMNQMSSPLQVGNAGLNDPRLMNGLPSPGSYSQLTSDFSPFGSSNQGQLNFGNSGLFNQLTQSPLSQSFAGLNYPSLAQNQLLSQVGQRANLGNVNTSINPGAVGFNAQGISPFQAQGADLSGVNSPFSQAIQQTLANKQNQDISDLRARFGASGGASRGTPAMYAETQLRSQQAPEIAAALGNVRQQEAGLNLQNAGMLNSANLQGRGQDISQLQTNQQGLLQAALANQNAGLQSQALGGQLGLQQRGQDLQNFTDSRGQDVGLFNAAIQNSAVQGNLGLGQRGQDITQFGNILDNQTNRLGTAAQYLNNMGGLQLGQRSQDLSNQQFNAGQFNQAGLQNRGLSLQDLQQQFQYGLGAGNMNSNNAQFLAGQSNQLNSQYASALQGGQESMYGRQANAYNQLAAYIAQLAGMGIPGGSANINVSPIQPQSGSGLGGMMGGLGTLLSGLAAF